MRSLAVLVAARVRRVAGRARRAAPRPADRRRRLVRAPQLRRGARAHARAALHEDADCRHWIREQYQLTGDRLVLASADLRTEKKRASCRDAGSYVTSDAHDEPVAFGAGVVAHGAALYYLTRDACRADAAARTARARWFAAPPPP